jgi:hypothetical protein
MKKILLAIGLIAASHAGAQTTDPIKVGDVDFTASLRSRIYVWDWFAPTSAAYQNQYAYSGNLARFNFAEKRGGFDWDIEIAVPFLLGLPTNGYRPGAAGRTRPRLQLLQRQYGSSVHRDGVRQTSLRALPLRR